MPETESNDTPTRLYGGQAIIEGVMIRGATSCAVAVRRADGSIHQESIPLLKWANGGLRKVPFIRGVLVLAETLVIGMRAYTIGANQQIKDADEDEDAEIGTLGIGLMTTIALVFGIGLFFLLPLFISRPFEEQSDFLANVAEGVARLVIFLAYIWAIGLMKDIKRMYGYHGAEHMTIHAHERGLPLTHRDTKVLPRTPKMRNLLPFNRRHRIHHPIHVRPARTTVDANRLADRTNTHNRRIELRVHTIHRNP